MASLPFSAPPQSLCILRLSAIGDCVHTLAVVRAIQAQWPACKITWVIGAIEHQLLDGVEGVEFIVFNKKEGLKGYQKFKQTMQGRTFDALLNMQIALRASLLSLCIPTPIKLGFDKPRAKDYQWLFTNHRIPATPKQHSMAGLFEFAKAIGVEGTDEALKNQTLNWRIPIPDEDKKIIDDTLQGIAHRAEQKLLVINPCSSQRSRNWRNWSASHYAHIAQYAKDHHQTTLVLTGGPADNEVMMGQAITTLCEKNQTPALNLIGKTSLKQLLALLARADAVISPDTGPAHMANAVHTPVIGLYATSNPYRTGPYCSLEYTVNAYPQALAQFSHTSEEKAKWGQRVRDPNAMSLITPEQVIEKLEAVFSNTQTS